MKKNFQARTFTGIRRSRVPRRWSADVSVDGEQAEVTSTFDAPCGNPLPWTRGKRNPSPSPRLLPESPFELLFRKKDRRYVYPIVSFYIRRDVSGSIVETRTTEEGGGGGLLEVGMTGGIKLAGIVVDPGTRMLGRLAITITIEGGGSNDTRRAATTRRSVRPNRASRFNTSACPYWAWASPARRTRTTASTIICRTCLPRTS